MQSRGVGLLAVLLAGQALANIDTAIVNVAAPAIHAELGASAAQVQLVVSGYVLAYAVLLIAGARLGDLYGHRRLFVLGASGFTLASLVCGLAPEPTTLIVARCVQGAAAALLVPQVLSGIQRSYTGDARTRALSLFVVALSASAVVGQILGGALLAADVWGSGWRSVFLVNVPIGGLLVPAALRWLPVEASQEPAPARDRPRQSAPTQRLGRVDLAGVVWLSLALLLLLVPLSLGREAGWPTWTWACLAASPPALAIFAWVERRRAERNRVPLVDLRLIARPEVAWALGSRAAAAGTYFALLFVLSLYLQQALNLSPLYAGLALVAWVGAFGSGGPLLRRLPRAVARRAATLGSLGMAFAYAGLAIGGGTSLALLVGSLGVGGLGFGLATTALLTHLTTVTPTRNAGEISGLYNTNSQVAAVAGLACFGTLYLGLADNPARAFGAVCVAFAATALLAAFAADQAVRVPASARVPSGGPIVAARPAAGTAAAGHPRAPGPAPSRAGRM